MKIFECLNCGTKNKWRGSSYRHKYCNNKCQQEFQYKEYIKNGSSDCMTVLRVRLAQVNI